MRPMSGAKKYNQSLSRDVSLAHDVSTVVALLNNYADLFSINACSKEQFLDAVRANSMYLRELADSIAYSKESIRIDAHGHSEIGLKGEVNPRRSVDAVTASIKKVCEAFSLAAQAKSIEVILNLSGQEGSFSNNQATVVERIVANLLGNAIEHSGATLVEVKTIERVHSDSQTGTSVIYCLEVSDNGRGLEPIYKSRLLNEEADNLPSRGLVTNRKRFRNRGLYGVKALAASIGARLYVTTSEGHGTAIGIELPPLEKSAISRKATLSIEKNKSSSGITTDCKDSKTVRAEIQNAKTLPNRKPCVCIVDDDEDILKVLHSVLQVSKIDAVLKTAWKPGDELLLDQVDIVLIDMNVGDVSGYEIASEIASRGFLGPVLAMTANPTLNTYNQNPESNPIINVIDKTQGAGFLLRNILTQLSTLGWLSDHAPETYPEKSDARLRI